MSEAQHSHALRFLTQPVEELTPDNDPESWASFQRALSKWKAKCAERDLLHAPSPKAVTAGEESGAAQHFGGCSNKG